MNARTFATPLLAALLAVLTLASSAWADCAWVAWQFAPSSANDREPWIVVGAFSRESGGEAACDKFANDANDQQKKKEQGKLLTIGYTCLPDTVDPRAPKASGRLSDLLFSRVVALAS